MYSGPVLAPIRAINNEYGNGRASMGSVIALTNTVTTVNAAAVGNVVGGVLGGVVGAVVGAVVGPVVTSPNQGRIGEEKVKGGAGDAAEAGTGRNRPPLRSVERLRLARARLAGRAR